jgi:hypothetical protein
MGNETLRKLARDYAVGNINKYDYRHKRNQLIDEITAANSATEAQSASIETFHPEQSHSASPAKSVFRPSSHHIIIAVAILAAAIVFVTMATSSNSKESIPTESTSHRSGSAQQLVSRFVSQQEWTSEQVSEFVAGWQRLPEAEKQQAQQTPWFQDLTATLKNRLSQEQALARAGSEQAQLNVQTIKSLGRLLSIAL